MRSGGYRWGKRRAAVESCYHLFLRAKGGTYELLFAPSDYSEIELLGTMPRPLLSFSLTVRRGAKEVKQNVPLHWTRCHFGGARPWLGCPRCGRRVGKLYLPTTIYYPSGERIDEYGCRHCWGLTYATRRTKHRLHRAQMRAGRIKGLLGASIRYESDGFPPKPKWMRRKTYERVLQRYLAEEDAMDLWLVERFGRLVLRGVSND